MESLFLRLGNEVRQGLHEILGLMALAAEQPLSRTQLEYLDRCRQAADQLLLISGDLAELSRPAGSAVPSAPFDVSQAIGEIAGLMGVLAQRKGLTFHWFAEPSLTNLFLGDKCLLQDMLRRLLDNAIRFTPAGIVRLTASCSGSPAGDRLLSFEISDTGTGIPPEVLEDSGAAIGPACMQGLSLRILRKRLAEMNGALSIVPNEPRGTIVRFTLPAAFAPAHFAAPSPAGSGPSMPILRILVAEDSDASFFLFESYVKTEGHHVSRALNGADAVAMAKRHEFDFVVMDANMPRMDGYTATRLLREWETERGRARLPILLLSADDLERQVRFGGAAGCSGFLTKPTTKAKLLAALNFYGRPPGEPAPISVN